jgi:hypothetical protein
MPDDVSQQQLEVPNAATLAAMQEARDGTLTSFDGISELIADLDAED